MHFLLLLLCLTAAAFGQPAPSRAVLMVSVDGLRPDYVTEAGRHGLKIPFLRKFMEEGAHARVRGVLPTSTYPSHTTLVTGTAPARHGIYANHPFEPEARNPHRWYWYAEDLRVPTLWDAAAGAGIATGSVSWPVTVGAPGIRFNIPEYAGTRTADDLKMLRVVATPPGLLAELEKKAGAYITDVNQALPRDWARTRHAVELVRKGARFVTVHLAALDHVQHRHGPFSPAALAALEEIDGMIARLAEATRGADRAAAVCIVSDHGFAPVERALDLDAAFVKAGLMPRIASPWPSSGSAAIVVKDARERARVKRFLDELAADPAKGIARILEREEIAALGGAPEAEFWVDMRPGFAIGTGGSGGTHGHAPAHAELHAFFLIAGEGIRKGLALGEIDMRAVAPTVARALGVAFPSADLAPLPVFGGR